MSISSSSDSERDDDMETVNRILMKSGASPIGTSNEPDSDSEGDIQDWFRQIQEKLSIPLAEANHFSDDDDDVAFETMRAIHDRIDRYEQLRSQEEETEINDTLSKSTKFPKSAQNFVEALKKNRLCQRFIRRKLTEIEARVEENKKLKERVKCLMDFQLACKRKVGQVLGQKKDPRVRLITTARKPRASKATTKVAASFLGPAENARVSRYRIAMERFPVSFSKKPWSNIEKESLAKGLKQQYQERLLVNSMNSESDVEGSMNPDMMALVLSNDLEVTPEMIRSFLALVDWDRLASMYVRDRSGAECESMWLNCEDPLIDHSSWTKLEDKKLLYIVQERGIYNWIDIAIMLGTRRTPFKCLVRYQRSLNPHILNRNWTENEDSMLCAAVEVFGNNNWQLVASNLEGRTGCQCSNRWRSTLHPDRRNVGKWSVDEDKRLKVAVTLFGAKSWNKIARFVPGRTQFQCRERWLNCLDPLLKLEPWTEEEDDKLLAAIDEHGYSWSKVATCVPRRTDSQCTRRWKTLCRRDVPLLQEAQRRKKTVLISNFVDREGERPSIGPYDFSSLVNRPISECENSKRRGSKRSREGARKENQIKKPSAKSGSSRNEIPLAELSIVPVVPNVSSDTAEIGSTKRRRGRKRVPTEESQLKISDGKPKKSRKKSGISFDEDAAKTAMVPLNVFADEDVPLASWLEALAFESRIKRIKTTQKKKHKS